MTREGIKRPNRVGLLAFVGLQLLAGIVSYAAHFELADTEGAWLAAIVAIFAGLSVHAAILVYAPVGRPFNRTEVETEAQILQSVFRTEVITNISLVSVFALSLLAAAIASPDSDLRGFTAIFIALICNFVLAALIALKRSYDFLRLKFDW